MTFGFRCRIISEVKLLVFEVKMQPQKMYFLLLKFISNNTQFITTTVTNSNKGFVLNFLCESYAVSRS